MKYLIIAFVLFMCATLAWAQIAPPFLTGDDTFGRPIELRCMNHQTFSGVMKDKNLHIAAMGEEQEDVTKVILVNPEGTIMSANIMKYGQVCVMDIIMNAYFSSEWKVAKSPTEENPN